MNKTFKIFTTAMALFCGQFVFAQNTDQSIDSFDELIEKVEEGLEEMIDHLDSDEFKDALEEAKRKSKDLKITQDDQGTYLFNGEPIDLDGLFEPAQDIADLFDNDLHISGDLDEILEKSGSMIESMMEELEKVMEESFKDLENIDLDLNDNKSKTKSL